MELHYGDVITLHYQSQYCLSTCLSQLQYHLYICLSESVTLSIHPSIHPCISLSIYLSDDLAIYLYIQSNYIMVTIMLQYIMVMQLHYFNSIIR